MEVDSLSLASDLAYRYLNDPEFRRAVAACQRAEELNRFFDCLDASAVPESREPEPAPATPPPLAPAWATVRFPTHPSDILKLLNDL